MKSQRLARLEPTTLLRLAALASLDVTAGTYLWTFGSGADADEITLDVVDPAALTPAPESTATLALFGAGLALFGLARLRLFCGRRHTSGVNDYASRDRTRNRVWLKSGQNFSQGQEVRW